VATSVTDWIRGLTLRKVVRILDSYATLLVLLLVNFFLLELIDDPRWGAIVSTLLAAVALVVAISDPDAGESVSRRQGILTRSAATCSSACCSHSCSWP
jgi:hypothetical protein